MTPEVAYQELERRFRRIGNVDGAAAVLQWDWATMMPEGGANARSNQLAELSLIRHELITDPRLDELIAKAETDGKALSDWQRANVREMRHRQRHANGVPPDLVEALSKAGAKCEMVWREARPKGDFKAFAESYKPLLTLVREKAAAKGAALGLAPYDAMIDAFDPGYTMAEIDRIFGALEKFLPDILARVMARQDQRPAPLPLKGRFPIEAQRGLGVKMMERLGFEFAHGRLDVSLHPFCGGVPDDVRITTRYDETDFAGALMGVLHETGHALYERGLPEAWRTQPVGDARGMSVHESQSLLVEMQACRSLEFLNFAAPLIREAFQGHAPVEGEAFEPANLYAHAIRVHPGYIRVDADEVTYPFHVMIRYGLEKRMIDGTLAVDDLPEAWNQGMKHYLGIVPPSPREGCLQDIHWTGGDLGYFPSYTLGALTAAQLFDAAKRSDADLVPAIARGDFRPLLAWLRGHVHSVGSLYDSRELVSRATGKPLDPLIFKAHLERRYLG
ncbi:MAG: carboxypeptidase M32 [Alphaproteobacteria bacterium]|nr:carboxypeptidase M32 [Alphaproteobacteria bacterium]